MNTKFLLFLFLSALSVCIAKAETDMPICQTQEECEDVNNPCSCYCAVACAPRDKIPGQDDPLFFEEDEDQYGKGCYCAQRDLDILDEGKNCDLIEQQKQ